MGTAPVVSSHIHAVVALAPARARAPPLPVIDTANSDPRPSPPAPPIETFRARTAKPKAMHASAMHISPPLVATPPASHPIPISSRQRGEKEPRPRPRGSDCRSDSASCCTWIPGDVPNALPPLKLSRRTNESRRFCAVGAARIVPDVEPPLAPPGELVVPGVDDEDGSPGTTPCPDRRAMSARIALSQLISSSSLGAQSRSVRFVVTTLNVCVPAVSPSSGPDDEA